MANFANRNHLRGNSAYFVLAWPSHHPCQEAVLTMVRLSRSQRAVLADKFPDFANVAVAALVFGQAFSGDPFSSGLALVGVAIWITFMLLAVVVVPKGE
jgi:hypothetical protein